MSMSETSRTEPGRPDAGEPPRGEVLDVARDSDIPISTQLYWQLAYQIDTGNRELAPRPGDGLRLQAAPGLRPAPRAL